MEEKLVEFAELVGKTILDIQGLEKGSEEVIFVCSDGSKYRMYHSQDCCECVNIDDVIGDVGDLIGSEIVIAEENSNSDVNPKETYDYSCTWTFYKLATKKGYVDIRWYGTSNGYYSERVDFVKIKEAIGGNTAEKEERIAVAKMLVNTDDEGSAKLDHFKIYSRQEAIDKISNYLSVCDIETMDNDEIAESALNALLEG